MTQLEKKKIINGAMRCLENDGPAISLEEDLGILKLLQAEVKDEHHPLVKISEIFGDFELYGNFIILQYEHYKYFDDTIVSILHEWYVRELTWIPLSEPFEQSFRAARVCRMFDDCTNTDGTSAFSNYFHIRSLFHF